MGAAQIWRGQPTAALGSGGHEQLVIDPHRDLVENASLLDHVGRLSIERVNIDSRCGDKLLRSSAVPGASARLGVDGIDRHGAHVDHRVARTGLGRSLAIEQRPVRIHLSDRFADIADIADIYERIDVAARHGRCLIRHYRAAARAPTAASCVRPSATWSAGPRYMTEDSSGWSSRSYTRSFLQVRCVKLTLPPQLSELRT